MRKIKFKIWHRLDKVMGYQFLKRVIAEDGTEFAVVAFSFGNGKICTLQDALCSKTLVLLEFTGLLDRNSVEIYEGDIIENLSSHMRAEVIFDNKVHHGFVAEVSVKDGYVCPILGDECVLVIGSVHENPELLQGGER